MVSKTHNLLELEALQRQEHATFCRMLRKYEALVASIGRRCGVEEHEVEDVVSETFLLAYKGLPSYRGDAAVSSWLCRIAYNQSISMLRKAGRARSIQEAPPHVATIDDPAGSLLNDELKEQLEEALKLLPLPWLEAITLRYWNHMDIAQIAKEMHVSEVSVRSYLFRARKSLRLTLDA